MVFYILKKEINLIFSENYILMCYYFKIYVTNEMTVYLIDI